LRPFNIKIKNIEPGAIKTDFENAIEFVTNDVYKNYVPKAHQNMLDSYKSAPTAEVVAKKVFQAANDNSFRLRYPVGGQSPILLFLRRVLPNTWFFAIVRTVVEKGIKK
jgi:short-subunit dehydrogenase